MQLSRRQHGLVDYGVAALELAVSSLLRRRPRTVALPDVGAERGAPGALTDYELGVLRVVPMRMHLALDGAVRCDVPRRACRAPRRGPSIRLALAMLSVGGALAAAATDPDA